MFCRPLTIRWEPLGCSKEIYGSVYLSGAHTLQVSTRERSHTRSSHNETVGITNLTPRHTNYFLVVQPYSKYIPVKLTPPSPHLVCFSQCFCSFRSNLHLKMFLCHPVWSECNVNCSRMTLTWEHTCLT